MNRRDFMAQAAKTAGSVALAGALTAAARGADAGERPNILWITCEDMSANLGCWGDPYALTPHIDRLAAQSVRYTHCYATAPVCSPARSCLITGLYATSMGTQGLRSAFPIPEAIRGFPGYLRDAGYYCTNNVKTDYNTSREPTLIADAWNESSARAHWRGRKPGQPFFAVFNSMTTHQSRTGVESFAWHEKEIRDRLAPAERHDPARAVVPPYYPDTPLVRRTLARYYDCITLMDREHVGALLAQLDEDGLADRTIVFFFSDNGAGLPRHKRLLHDSGLRLPLLIRFPDRYSRFAPARSGETLERLVSFVDFPPTVLSLAGLPVPDYMEGRAFLGPAAGEPREHVYGARDRVDEAFDVARSVRDQRYLYIRNYMPHLSYNQPEGYSDQADIRREITRLAAEGKLGEAQLTYAGPTRPRQALYDAQDDPHQMRNLADSPAHRAIVERMRGDLRAWVLETRDLGFLAESDQRERSAGTTPSEMARRTDRYPLEKILDAAELVGRTDAVARQIELLADADAGVRYWAAVGLRAAGNAAAPAREALAKALTDPAPAVRIEAAGALAALGDSREAPEASKAAVATSREALEVLARALDSAHDDEAIHAARTLQLLGAKAQPVRPAIEAALARARAADTTQPRPMYTIFALEPLLALLSS